MSEPLGDLRRLRDELVARQWVMTCFPFTYKARQYFVLARRYRSAAETPPNHLLELTFVDRLDVTRTLTAGATPFRIDAGAQAVREFFGIEWKPNLRDLLTQLSTLLGQHIPVQLPTAFGAEERRLVVQQLDEHHREGNKGVYCFAARRNRMRADGTPGQRSDFNSQKTEMLRPELYNRLKHDTNVSFFYSEKPAAERDDAAILASFS